MSMFLCISLDGSSKVVVPPELVNYCSNRAMEFPMTGNVDRYVFYHSQRLDDGTNIRHGVHQGGQVVYHALETQQQARNQAGH